MMRRLPPRWRLVPRVLPVVALVAVAKVIVDQAGGEGLGINPLFTGLVAANVFLLGFLRSPERLPTTRRASGLWGAQTRPARETGRFAALSDAHRTSEEFAEEPRVEPLESGKSQIPAKALKTSGR
jgi:hypothetical protein